MTKQYVLSILGAVLCGLVLSQQFHVIPSGSGGLDPCKYFENVTDIQSLNHHEFVAFEQCLYYFLANKAQQSSTKLGSVHPIATLPPTYGSSDQKSVKVRVGQITLQHFQLVRSNSDQIVNGVYRTNFLKISISWAIWRCNGMTIV